MNPFICRWSYNQKTHRVRRALSAHIPHDINDAVECISPQTILNEPVTRYHLSSSPRPQQHELRQMCQHNVTNTKGYTQMVDVL